MPFLCDPLPLITPKELFAICGAMHEARQRNEVIYLFLLFGALLSNAFHFLMRGAKIFVKAEKLLSFVENIIGSDRSDSLLTEVGNDLSPVMGGVIGDVKKDLLHGVVELHTF